jgi:hypothetical protein
MVALHASPDGDRRYLVGDRFIPDVPIQCDVYKQK